MTAIRMKRLDDMAEKAEDYAKTAAEAATDKNSMRANRGLSGTDVVMPVVIPATGDYTEEVSNSTNHSAATVKAATDYIDSIMSPKELRMLTATVKERIINEIATRAQITSGPTLKSVDALSAPDSSHDELELAKRLVAAKDTKSVIEKADVKGILKDYVHDDVLDEVAERLDQDHLSIDEGA